MTTQLNIPKRADEVFLHKQQLIYAKTDRVFAYLMIFQWIAGIIFALVISPRTWIGTTSYLHLHVYMAIFLGLIIALPPVVLAFARPGLNITKYVVAVSQIFFSILLIHLTGGRIETHFHVFGSLAFLAFYRDWKVLVLASGIVAIDHLVRGIWYPQSVFGVFAAEQWRWLEHAAWVIFENIFLFKLVNQSISEMKETAYTQAELEKQKKDLLEANIRLEEFAYISAHDMKSPLISINNMIDILEAKDAIKDGFQKQFNLVKSSVLQARDTLTSLNKVISFRKTLNIQKERIEFADILNDMKLSLAGEIEKNNVEFRVDFSQCPRINYPKIHLTSIMQNLISNSIKYRKIEVKPVIKIQTKKERNQIYLIIEDNGKGIDLESNCDKLFGLFQRFSQDVEGTGIGLHLVNSIVQSYNGSIEVSSEIDKGTRFEILLSNEENLKGEINAESFVLNR